MAKTRFLSHVYTYRLDIMLCCLSFVHCLMTNHVRVAVYLCEHSLHGTVPCRPWCCTRRSELHG